MVEKRYRDAADSQIILKELMIPSYGNFGGKVHGGVILSLMDKVAYACAASHCKSYCVTASVDKVDFLNPVEVGELLTLYSSVNYTGNTSMEIGIRVVSEDFRSELIKHTNTSYFTMVALDEETKKPTNIPGLILRTDQEIRRYVEGRLRRKLRRMQRESFSVAKNEIDLINEVSSLERENCQVIKI